MALDAKKFSTGKTTQTSAISANPQRTIFRYAKSRDNAAIQFRRVLRIENGELRAIETRQTFLGSDPQVTIVSLNDSLDRILRKTFIGLPDANVIINSAKTERNG